MSIIQEALKKVQDGKMPPQDIHAHADEALAVKPPSPPRTVSKPFIAISAAALIIVTAIFGINLYYSMKKAPAAKTNEPAAVQQSVSYKPIAPEASSPAVPVQSQADLKQSPPKLVLNGIMYLPDSPRAIINGNTVEVGDSVSGAEVRRINRDNVVLNFNSVEITIDLE